MEIKFRRLKMTLLFVALGLSFSTWAADFKCSVCSMKIPEHAKNHILLRNQDPHLSPLHVCSIFCAKKAKKYDPKYSKAEVTDFNHPDKTLSAEKAFFLKKSEKIKADLGELAMSPYWGAFSTKAEAQAAQKKYGDGEVVLGFEEALK